MIQHWRLLLLRFSAWLVCLLAPGAHPVAALIRAGQWAALDRILDDLDREAAAHG